MLHIQDKIERSLTIAASRMTVWEKSFATPAALSSWFPERIEGEFAVGASFTMFWGEMKSECRLVEYVEGVSLAYQWHPGMTGGWDVHPESELTTVRFTLSEEGAKTVVTMVETGFMNIPATRHAEAFNENSGGWDSELPKLARSYEA